MSTTIVTADLIQHRAFDMISLGPQDGTDAQRNFVVCVPARLPAGHPAKTIMPTDDLVRSADLRVLVLGELAADGQPLASYLIAEAAALTKQLSAAQAAGQDAFLAKLLANGYEDLGQNSASLYVDGYRPPEWMK